VIITPKKFGMKDSQTDITTLVKENASKWIQSPFDIETQHAAQQMMDDNSEELIESFYTDLAFGTGGMRGIMGVGTNRVNKYTFGRATQALADLLNQQYENGSVAIAFDCRNNSLELSNIVADILSANGIKAYIFNELRPTPQLSFMVRHLGCSAGIVITASHNPPEYNGYKVYGNDGCQIVAPFDKQLIDQVLNTQFDEIKFDRNEGLVEYLDGEADEIYLNAIKTLSLSPKIIQAQELSIVYTGLHGTGAVMVRKALEKFGFNEIHTVYEQDKIDGNFSTVDSPNPEEPAALKMAMKLADQLNSDLVMGTDPDADRVGIAIRSKNGNLKLLNGNQTGALLIYYILKRSRRLELLEGNEFIAKTVVTTELIDKMSLDFGVKVYNTLTGFKHIGAVIREKEGKEKYLAGGEESYGYLVGDLVRDKDGVSACCMIAEMMVWAQSKDLHVEDLLAEIYMKYGFYQEDLVSVTKKGRQGADEIAQMVENFRSNPPVKINGSTVSRMIDYKSLEEKNMLDGSIQKVNLPSSNFMQFYTEDGSKITVRPSGTEPKIKFYFSVNGPLNSPEEYLQTEKLLKEKIQNIKDDLGI